MEYFCSLWGEKQMNFVIEKFFVKGDCCALPASYCDAVQAVILDLILHMHLTLFPLLVLTVP